MEEFKVLTKTSRSPTTTKGIPWKYIRPFTDPEKILPRYVDLVVNPHREDALQSVRS